MSQSVREQVGHNLLQSNGVPLHQQRALPCLQAHGSSVCLVAVHYGGSQRIEIEWGRLQAQVTGVGERQRSEVIDQPTEHSGLLQCRDHRRS